MSDGDCVFAGSVALLDDFVVAFSVFFCVSAVEDVEVVLPMLALVVPVLLLVLAASV